MLAVAAFFNENEDGTWLETEALGYGYFRKLSNRLAFLVLWTEPMRINMHHPLVNKYAFKLCLVWTGLKCVRRMWK